MDDSRHLVRHGLFPGFGFDIVGNFTCSVEQQNGQTATVSNPTSCSIVGDYGYDKPFSNASGTFSNALGVTPVTSYSASVAVTAYAISGSTDGSLTNILANAEASLAYTVAAWSGGSQRAGFIQLAWTATVNTIDGSSGYSVVVGDYSTGGSDAECAFNGGGCILPFELGVPFAVAISATAKIYAGGTDDGGSDTTVGLTFSLLEADGVTPVAFSAPPDAPVLTSPLNGATGVMTTPTLTWNASNGATSYDVYFGTSATPPMVTNVSTTSYAPGTLSAATTYYWHIVARNSSTTTDSGTPWSFTTAGTSPGTPALSFPANGATGIATSASLSWGAAAGARSYDVYFGTSSPPPFVTNTTATTFSPGTLAGGTVYYWFVVARNGVGTATSATWTFTTLAPLQFYSVTPCRLVDTRIGQGKTGAFGPPSLAASAERDFPLLSGGCSIPSGAAAYSLNITAVPDGPLGFLSVWPTGEPFPGVSTLNSTDGSIIANAAIVPAGTGGSIALVAGNPTDVVIDINGYFAPAGISGAPLDFYPLTPCRIADTRAGQGKNGPFGPPSPVESVTRDFPIFTSPCLLGAPIPSAYSLNMTVVPDEPLGFLSAWPAGAAYPGVSTLNSPDATALANAAIVPAGINFDIDVLASGPTDLIIDINGVFGSPGGPGGLRFYVVTPCRIADTRTGQGFTGAFGPPSLAADITRNFPIQSSPCGIPATAQAYALNMTAVPQGPLSFLSTWPTGQPYPGVSTLNSSDGYVIANAAIVPVGTGGAITVVAGNATDLIIDVVGYFAP